MPLDPAGNASLVPSYFAEPGTTIRTDQHNPVLEDIAAMISAMLVRDGRNGMVGNLNMGSFAIRNLAPGTNPTDAATVSQGVPIGTVLDFAGSTAPEGYLLCFGQAISRSAYASLFSVIGTTYGAGDGSTTFNLPDFRGRVGAGRDNMGGTSASRLSFSFGSQSGTLGASGGTLDYEYLTIPMLPAHNHNVYLSDPGHRHGYGPASLTSATGSATSGIWLGGSDPSRYVTGLSTTGMTISSAPNGSGQPNATELAGSNQPHRTVQPTIIINKIIKVSL